MNDLPPSVDSTPASNGGSVAEPSSLRFPLLLLAVPVLALCVGLTLFFTTRSVSFPILAEGLYGGSLTLIGTPAPYPFAVEQNEGKEVLVTVLLPGWIPSRFAIGSGYGDTFEAILQSPEGTQYKLSGTVTDKGGASGLATNLNGEVAGSWVVTPAIDDRLPESTETSLVHALLVRAERAGLREAFREVEQEIAQINGTRVSINQRRGDIETLTRGVEERRGVLLANEGKIRSQIESLSLEASTLRSQLELSLNVTPAGKLVTLARQSLERENQWISLVAFSSPFADGSLNDLREQFRQTLEVEKLQKRASELGVESSEEVPHEAENPSSGDAFGSIWDLQ